MNFSVLQDNCQKWDSILVIGRTFGQGDRKCHIIGMTMADEANLYLIETYEEPEPERRTGGKRTYRRLEKENLRHQGEGTSWLRCKSITIGGQKLEVAGGNVGSLGYEAENIRTIQMFLDMIRAGWEVPDWLRDEEWKGNHLWLVTLRLANVERLPEYAPGMPIVLSHDSYAISHIAEKTVTLQVGKGRSFSFTDHCGDEVWCHVNNVVLVNMWKHGEERFLDPRYREHFSEEEIQKMKEEFFQALEPNCPKGMCYLGVEYECSKDYALDFESKEHLKSCPTSHSGSASVVCMLWKPDHPYGEHGLPLRGNAIQEPFPPDTLKVPAELFSYQEKKEGWDEEG